MLEILIQTSHVIVGLTGNYYEKRGDTFQLCRPSVVVGAASVRGLVVASLSSSLSLSHGAQPSRSGGQIVNAELAAAAIRCTEQSG